MASKVKITYTRLVIPMMVGYIIITFHSVIANKIYLAVSLHAIQEYFDFIRRKVRRAFHVKYQ